jgi:hypothetical protein
MRWDVLTSGSPVANPKSGLVYSLFIKKYFFPQFYVYRNFFPLLYNIALRTLWVSVHKVENHCRRAQSSQVSQSTDLVHIIQLFCKEHNPLPQDTLKLYVTVLFRTAHTCSKEQDTLKLYVTVLFRTAHTCSKEQDTLKLYLTVLFRTAHTCSKEQDTLKIYLTVLFRTAHTCSKEQDTLKLYLTVLFRTAHTCSKE